MKLHFYFPIVVLIFSIKIFGQTAGDIQNIEPGLQSRNDILFYEGFTTTNWGDRWDMASEGGNTTINSNGFDGSCLNYFLKQGSYGASGSGNTAMSTFLKSFSGVESLHEELYFRYYIYLDPNFDFSQGGKIPGMASHALYGAGSHPNGDDGWTARYMWNSYGEIYLYGYFPVANGWGTHIYCDYTGKRARLERGKWHCVEQYIKLNSVTGSTGNADGKCYTWLDGTLSMKKDDVVYRTVVNDAGKEFGIYASVFFGGADADWTPEYDTYIRVDNMVLAKNYIGPRSGTNMLTMPTINNAGGSFTSPVNVSITAGSNDEIRYTTNGSEPTYWSEKYVNPLSLSKSATVKARSFNASNPRFSSVIASDYTISTNAGSVSTTKNANADAYFRNGSYKNTNYGSEATMELKTGSFGYDRKAVIKFPLSNLSGVSSAKLRLNASVVSASTKVGIFEMPSDWTETAITSKNAPGAGDFISSVVTSAAGWLEFDVTNYVSSKISQGASEASFYIMIMNYEDEVNTASLKSRTATSGQPELVVINVAENKKTYKILCFGESTTASGTGGPSYRKGLQDSLAIHNISFDFIGSKTDDNVQSYDKNHQGMSGESCAGLSNWMKNNYANYQADIILLWEGTNDCGWAWQYGGISSEKQFSNLLDTIVKYQPNAHIFCSTIPPMADNAYSASNPSGGANSRAIVYNSTMSSTVQRYRNLGKNVYFVDTRGVILLSDLQSDGIHPTQAGYNKMSPYWWNAIKPVVGVSQSVDTQVPTAPTALISSNVTENSFSLSWTASTDNVGVISYDVYKDGTLLGNTASTSFNVSGLLPSTSYSMTVKAKDAANNVSGASAALSVTTSGTSVPVTSAPIMYEPFNYTVSSTNPDPDGGTVNGGNGLPFTNTGGSPSGTGIGLYGNWGANLSVADGLTYSGLQTTGGSANPTVAAWGNGAIRAYRFMTTDPYANLRYYVNALSNKAGFSYDGTTSQIYYISFLAKVTTIADNNFRLVLAPTGDNNGGDGTTVKMYIVSTNAGKWTLSPNGSNQPSTAECEANVTALLLIKIGYTGGNVNFSLWKNPPLMGSLPTANATATMSYTQFNGFLGFNYRPASATAMYFDELRLGKTPADVLPLTITTVVPVFYSKLKIYPTVCTTYVIVESVQGETIILSDLTGKTVLKTKSNSDIFTIDVSTLNAGIYFVRLGNSELAAKFVKK